LFWVRLAASAGPIRALPVLAFFAGFFGTD